MNTETYSANVKLLAESVSDSKPVAAVLLVRRVDPLEEELEPIGEIHRRAETMTSLLKGILDYQPPTHWGLNE